MTKKPFRILALAALLAVVVAACGQKPGVHNPLAVGGGGGTTGDVVGVTTGSSGTATTGDLTGGGATGTAGAGSTAGTATGSTAGTTGAPIAGDRTGIFPDKIVIGIHAPLTGAAPFSPAAFEKGRDLYWKWLHNDKKQLIHGRRVEVIFRDDQYTPSTAVNVCNQMATQLKAFLLIGGGGTDQINACANYADPRGIPYFSPGVQEAGLANRRTYFAVSMTYKQQMPLLVQMLKKQGNLNRYGGPEIKVGHVRPNTPNFNDADQALKAAVLAAGWQYKVYTVVKEGNSSEAKTVATQLRQDNVDIVIPISAPTFTTQLAINTGGDQYKPLYAGVGITNNLNQMIANVCRQQEFQGALFFSPWPGWKQVMGGEYDAQFRLAATKYARDVNTIDKGGDILLALWGISRTIHELLEAAGKDLTRQSFVQTASSFKLKTGMFPDLDYTRAKPFGARNVNLLKGSCDEQGDGQYVSRGPQFVTHPDYRGLRSSF